MERETVEVFSNIVKKLVVARSELSRHLEGKSYENIRDTLNDCIELASVHCDTAPIRLIAGQVDEIVENFNCKR